MLNLKKALVVIDPDSEQQPALDKILVLEKYIDLEIKLIACDYTQYLVEGYYFDAIDLPRLRKEYLQERQEALESMAAGLREQGLTVETAAFWAHPGYETIVREAVDYGADLVVQHTRRHAAISRMFLSNDDWQLVRCCPVPLLLVKEKPWADVPVILSAVDPKHARHKPIGLDHKILNVATEIEGLVKGELHVLHSYNQIPLSGTYPRQAREEHENAFATLMADFNVPEERQHLMEEAPEFSLKKLEEKLDANLVIMGAISRNVLSEVFIGNTTEKVLDYLESDVLVIKPDGFETPVKLE
ncbi:MAG: universal stress protein [Pseudomonadales bacterium]